MKLSPDLKELTVAFMAKQDQWLRAMIVSHPASEDVYWRHVSYIMAQFDGLYAGYKSVAESEWVGELI